MNSKITTTVRLIATLLIGYASITAQENGRWSIDISKQITTTSQEGWYRCQAWSDEWIIESTQDGSVSIKLRLGRIIGERQRIGDAIYLTNDPSEASPRVSREEAYSSRLLPSQATVSTGIWRKFDYRFHLQIVGQANSQDDFVAPVEQWVPSDQAGHSQSANVVEVDLSRLEHSSVLNYAFQNHFKTIVAFSFIRNHSWTGDHAHSSHNTVPVSFEGLHALANSVKECHDGINRNMDFSVPTIVTSLITSLGNDLVMTPSPQVPILPPFQSETVRVLSEDGILVATLQTKEGGGFTLGEEDFDGGPNQHIILENNDVYELTFENGSWIAREVSTIPAKLSSSMQLPFNEVETQEVHIPIAAGYFKTLTLGSDDRWRDESGWVIENGDWVEESGKRYTLTLDRQGRWSAAYLPRTAKIEIRSSTPSVRIDLLISQQESGEWETTRGQIPEGCSLKRLLANWVVQCDEDVFHIALGLSDVSVTITYDTRDGRWEHQRGGGAASAGAASHVLGRYYEYIRLESGEWTVKYLPIIRWIPVGGPNVRCRERSNTSCLPSWVADDGNEDRLVSGRLFRPGSILIHNGKIYQLKWLEGRWVFAEIGES